MIETLGQIARMGGDPSGLAVLGDVLQESGHPLGEAISRLLLNPGRDLRYLGLEELACPPLRFQLPVFQLVPLARRLGLSGAERALETELVLLPPIPGPVRFAMGGAEWDHEGPVHEVQVQPFLVGRTPVTVGAYRAVLPDRATDGEPSWPVCSVTWDELQSADGFLARLGLRLPSEAEWEFACRGGSDGAWCFGGDRESLARYAHLGWGQAPRAVARGLPNAYGLFDVHGNVKEWCQDRWHDSYRGAPIDGRPWLEGRSQRRVLRGGSRNTIPVSCRCAAREAAAPGRRSGAIGFRPARSP